MLRKHKMHKTVVQLNQYLLHFLLITLVIKIYVQNSRLTYLILTLQWIHHGARIQKAIQEMSNGH